MYISPFLLFQNQTMKAQEAKTSGLQYIYMQQI